MASGERLTHFKIFSLALRVVAAVNLAILCVIGYQSHATHRKYTWLNEDYPLLVPVGELHAVEMTFHESARFGLDVASQKNWETLQTNQRGVGFQHFGPFHFRSISGAYHSLHCIYTMQRDFNKPNHIKNSSHHFTHCLMYLRQVLLCNADLTLEDGDFAIRNYTTDRIGQTKTCRDWRKVADWLNENNKEWAAYNGISFG